ncbi:MAG: hypothetical protein PGMFKBFP_02101 [Anaerolineales bacterium]|nr:hypothetical protein [Anaerolineales bacterium]MBW7918602.1 DUF4870 domain-containing protein [Anaerolineales bacterium]MCZ2290021.1 DUF4870 domain-containing protein [Anaerolineales bacterium]
MSENFESDSPAVPISSDERLMAALAHGSVVVSFFGPAAPMLIWVFQRRKSSYVAFHALQAMGYQMLAFWVGAAAYLLFFVLLMAVVMPALAIFAQKENSAIGMLLFEGSFFLSFFGFMAVYFLVGIVGAIFSLMGKDFKVPFLGKWLARYLGRGEEPLAPLDETKSEQWAAGVCHGSAILLIWGIFTPLIAWLAEKDKSPRLRFQSMQAFVYQLLAAVAYFGYMFVYMFMFMGLFVVVLFRPRLGDMHDNSLLLLVILVFIGIMTLFFLFFMLVIPLYHLFAMIAGIRTVQGREYRYPLLGNFLMRRFGDKPGG